MHLNQFPLSQLNEMFESTPIPDGDAELLHTQIGAIFEEEYASYNSEKAFELLSLEVVKNLVFSNMNRSLFDIDSSVIGDANDEGIDAYIIQDDPMGTNYGLTLVQSKWHENVPNNKLVKDNHEPLDKLCATAMRIWKGSTLFETTKYKNCSGNGENWLHHTMKSQGIRLERPAATLNLLSLGL